MALPTNYVGLEATKLHQNDFLPKYKELKSKFLKANPDLPKNSPRINKFIYSEIGYPHWNEAKEAGKPGTPGFEPYAINQDKPRKVSHRQISQAKAGDKRDVYEKLSNAHLTSEQQTEWNDYRKSLSKKFQLDHKREIQETGPEIETLNKWRKKGWISKSEYKKGMDLITKMGSGNDVDLNAQPLSDQENSYKRTQVAKKNEALKQLEKKKLSNRFNLGKFKNKTFEQIFASVKDALKINGNGNTNGGLKINNGGAAALERTSPNTTNNLKNLGISTLMAGNQYTNALQLLNTLTKLTTGKSVAERVESNVRDMYLNPYHGDNTQLRIKNKAKETKERNEKILQALKPKQNGTGKKRLYRIAEIS